MVVRIGSNIASLAIQRRLADTSDELSDVSSRLASGQRINRPSSDAAGLSVASMLEADTRVYSQSLRNVNDGVSAMSIAEGALDQLGLIVERQLELAQQAANGTYSIRQREAMHDEADALVSEYNRIIATTRFNGQTLLDGSARDLRIQAGYGTDETLRTTLGSFISGYVGTGTFRAGVSISATSPSIGFAQIVDINRDGRNDIVFNDYGRTATVIHLGNGDGSFRAETTVPTGSGSNDRFVLSDMNNDGILDLINSQPFNNSIAVNLGTGNGTFGTARTFIASGQVEGVNVADFNRDGIMDVVFSSATEGTISVMLGNGDGSLRSRVSFAGASTSSASNGPDFINVGDFNNDEILDVLIGRQTDNAMRLYLGNGNGAFQAPLVVATSASSNNQVVHDFNRDGFLDIVSGGGSVLMGNGDGSFRQGVSLGFSPSRLTSADLNGDGLLDLIGINFGGGTTRAVLGNGDGTFQLTSSFAAPGNGNYVTAGDMNGDGALDLLTAVDTNPDALTMHLSNTILSSNQARFSLMTRWDSLAALTTLREDLGVIQQERGFIGALQSRLGVTLNVLRVRRDSMEGARSQIIDTDIAEESAGLTRRRILQQVQNALLGQANLQPQIALDLLRG